MAITRRYVPSKDPDEICVFGMDYSFVIPKGVGIAKGELRFVTNSNPSLPADDDWEFGPAAIQQTPVAPVVQIRGRTLYAKLGGGFDGVDYLLIWTATDTEGNVWPRAAAVLVGRTS